MPENPDSFCNFSRWRFSSVAYCCGHRRRKQHSPTPSRHHPWRWIWRRHLFRRRKRIPTSPQPYINMATGIWTRDKWRCLPQFHLFYLAERWPSYSF